MAKFSRTYELLCESVDCNDRLRPNSFMSFAQDIADMDVERMGAGFRQLQPKGIAWILARMRFTISEPAVWKEKVLLQTWHRGTQGPFFIRDYVLLGEDGSTKVTGVSSWVILNTGDRTLMKMSDAEGILPAGQDCDEAGVEPCPKIVFPKGVEKVRCRSRIVSQSDLDHNGHTNNTMYVSWALDCLPLEVTTRDWCKEVSINFSRETRPGEEIALFMAETSPGVFFVEGLRGEELSFTVKLVF